MPAQREQRSLAATPSLSSVDGALSANVPASPVMLGHIPLLNALRGLSAQVIVWHHLAFYGPLSDTAAVLIPTTIDILYRYGRFVVYVFLVMAGYLMARQIERTADWTLLAALRQIGKRYLRLLWPYTAVLGIAILANAWADEWMDHESIAAPPTIGQIVAHLFLVHQVAGYEALSAGIWYLAIDLQLAILSIVVMTACASVARVVPQGTDRRAAARSLYQSAILVLATLALFWWNRDDQFDIWCLFYVGSYALGMAAYWYQQQMLPKWWLGVLTVVICAALVVEWRPRLAVAVGAALLIATLGTSPSVNAALNRPWLTYLGRISYSLFLIHFPVCLLVNGWWADRAADDPGLALRGMAVAYGASLAAAILLHHFVERGDGWQWLARRWSRPADG